MNADLKRLWEQIGSKLLLNSIGLLIVIAAGVIFVPILVFGLTRLVPDWQHNLVVVVFLGWFSTLGLAAIVATFGKHIYFAFKQRQERLSERSIQQRDYEHSTSRQRRLSFLLLILLSLLIVYLTNTLNDAMGDSLPEFSFFLRILIGILISVIFGWFFFEVSLLRSGAGLLNDLHKRRRVTERGLPLNTSMGGLSTEVRSRNHEHFKVESLTEAVPLSVIVDYLRASLTEPTVKYTAGLPHDKSLQALQLQRYPTAEHRLRIAYVILVQLHAYFGQSAARDLFKKPQAELNNRSLSDIIREGLADEIYVATQVSNGETEDIHNQSLHSLDYIENIKWNISNIRTLIVQGNPHLAALLARLESDTIVEVLRRGTSEKNYETLLRLLADTISSHGLAQREYLPREDVVSVTAPSVREMRRIAVECKDRRIAALADYAEADALYIRGIYDAALPRFTEAFASLEDIDIRLMAQRGILLCRANVRDKRGFADWESKTMNLVASGNVSLYHTSRLLEASARANIILDHPDAAFVALDEASKTYHELEASEGSVPFLVTQQNRTRLELMISSGPGEKSELEKLGTAAISSAARWGYSRHATDITRLLEMYL